MDLVAVGEFADDLHVSVTLLDTGKTITDIAGTDEMQFVIVGEKVYMLVLTVQNGNPNYTLSSVNAVVTYGGKQVAASQITSLSMAEIMAIRAESGMMPSMSEESLAAMLAYYKQLGGAVVSIPLTAEHIPGEEQEENYVP